MINVGLKDAELIEINFDHFSDLIDQFRTLSRSLLRFVL